MWPHLEEEEKGPKKRRVSGWTAKKNRWWWTAQNYRQSFQKRKKIPFETLMSLLRFQQTELFQCIRPNTSYFRQKSPKNPIKRISFFFFWKPRVWGGFQGSFWMKQKTDVWHWSERDALINRQAQAENCFEIHRRKQTGAVTLETFRKPAHNADDNGMTGRFKKVNG